MSMTIAETETDQHDFFLKRPSFTALQQLELHPTSVTQGW
jgi:hypothetical protein